MNIVLFLSTVTVAYYCYYCLVEGTRNQKVPTINWLTLRISAPLEEINGE